MFSKKIQKVLEGKGGNYIFPFFWQHGESEDVLREYMEMIHRSNIGAVCIESRPHPDFCGEGWWHDMDIILDEARKYDMKVWILDDSHFPTGYANGAMKDQPDELCRQSLCCRKLRVETGSTLHLTAEQIRHPAPFEKNMAEQYVLSEPMRVFDDDRLLTVCARNALSGQVTDLTGLVKDDCLDWAAPEGEWTVYILHLSRNYGYHRDYINMMDRRSCRVLIDAVYEPHYAHYQKDFGKTIAGFFSDEPELGNGHLYDIDDPYGGMHDYPWSAELEQELQMRLGTEYALKLTLLWENNAPAEETARLRCIFMDTVTSLVQKDFSGQIGSWCKDHGVEYIGHLIEDDNHHSRTGSSLGHYFRGLSGQDMAGIDDIGGQVFPQGENINYFHNIFAHRNGEFYHYLLGKLADSAAAIQPHKRGRAMCEIFGNYGWSEGVRLEKYLIDHFLVRGINHFVPHAFSAKEYPDPDCPPHFYAHGNNPQFRHFGCLMAYTNRLCELLNEGRHIAPVAVLYHAESDWTGEHMTADKAAHRLVDAQIDYDILPQDVFEDRAAYRTVISNNCFTVNTQSYRAFILPYSQFITSAAAEAVKELKQAGIPVFMVGGLPEGICKGDASLPELKCVSLEELVPELIRLQIPELNISPENNRIRYRHYVHDDGMEMFFFVNEGTETWSGKVQLPLGGKTYVYRYDAWENHLSPADISGNTLSLSIEPLHSEAVIFDPAAVMEDLKPFLYEDLRDADRKQELAFSSGWLRDICRSKAYPSFTGEKAIQLPDTLAQEEPEFSGFVRYRNQFEAKAGEKVLLEISDACEGVEVFLNGQSLGIQIVPPFRYDLSQNLKDGRNSLSVEVSTTLERENSGIPDVTGQIRTPSALSGITGTVRLFGFDEYPKNQSALSL